MGQPCKCGCGVNVKADNVFIRGHNARGGYHPMLGKKMSDETLEKLRASHLGKPSHMKGKTHTEETRKK